MTEYYLACNDCDNLMLIFVMKTLYLPALEYIWGSSRNLSKSAAVLQLLKRSRYTSSAASSKFNQSLTERLAAIKEAGTWKEERVITSKQGAEINVLGSQNKILNFCANNYLGLSVCACHVFCDILHM